MMSCVEDLLMNSLNELLKDEWSRFLWHLKKHGFSASELENASVLSTVDKMMDRYKKDGAVECTLTILRKMNKNNQAELLEDKVKSSTQL
ncbi:caspace-like protein [Triplophysa rosa]|uniref:Caspace-like protein n=1 Tax=Triplophysa rosa TaxID=992332 RepID=A0A9W7W8T3_TRIRA|nr:caspace-like protein [Triplophysa rosa]